MIGAHVIIDTNVVSYLMRRDSLAEQYRRHVEGRLAGIAFITVGELYYGAEKKGWGERRRRELETMLRNFIVVSYDHEIARCYGRLVARRQRDGRPIAPNDAWIAACAVRHEVALVTHNEKDFKGVPSLEIITARTR